jgi:hypothetical protein
VQQLKAQVNIETDMHYRRHKTQVNIETDTHYRRHKAQVNIESAMQLIEDWYYLKYLLDWYSWKAAIASTHTR